MTAATDAAFARHHMTASRRRVLEIMTRNEPLEPDDIAMIWTAGVPSLSPGHSEALPGMVRHMLWRLERLEWVERRDHGLVVTLAGRRALVLASSEPE